MNKELWIKNRENSLRKIENWFSNSLFILHNSWFAPKGLKGGDLGFILWYIYSIKKLSQIVWLIVLKNLDYFSIPILLKTLFAPWKRDVLSTQNLSLNEKMRMGVFNLMSRLIGAVIRLFTIFFGLILTLLLLIFGIIVIIIWAFLPFILLIGFIYGIILIFQG